MRTVVLIPCYNEAPTISSVVKSFKALAPDIDVYVYDNNSTDETANLALEAGAIVVPEYRQGKGFVVRSMFRDIDADCYVMVDGDDTYRADEALALCEFVAQGRADMVIGDRLSSTYFEQNKRPLHGIGNRLVRFLVNRIFRSNVRDIMTGCRCFSRTFVKSFPVLSGGFQIESEMTVHALDHHFLLHEVPIDYRDRPEGSFSKLSTISDGFLVLKTIFTLFRDYRPMVFFGLISSVLFIVSMVMFAIPLSEYVETGLVAKIPTLVVAVALGTGAMLALVCGVILESMRIHARQSYELTLTMLAEQDRTRR
ncbi:MAG: glycosyl transferase [Actinobacteria bacterium HGW-Actinobacteria-6]|jgi:glycosyltransferase involved in cell wall biosynthesis|nr:MAG: glycosyl transferase [Actinobacteria bacterium HGW-Actinobacteria-6]